MHNIKICQKNKLLFPNIIILLNLLQLRLLQLVPFFTLPIIYHMSMLQWPKYIWKWTGIYFYWNCQPKKSNIIVGVIYRLWSMDLTDFNCNYVNKLLENIFKEQKCIFLLGDFNVNLLNYIWIFYNWILRFSYF